MTAEEVLQKAEHLLSIGPDEATPLLIELAKAKIQLEFLREFQSLIHDHEGRGKFFGVQRY
jgi:hypothetical protein